MQSVRGTGKRIDGQGSNWIRRSTRFAIYARDGFCCVYCGAKASVSSSPMWRIGLDHVRSVARGGEGLNEATNLVTCCQACNAKKGEMSARRWCHYLAARWGCSPRQVAHKLRARVRRPLDRAEGRRLADVEATSGYLAAIAAG